jgi:folylpolyglutamate synthase/dihydrofolate synthase
MKFLKYPIKLGIFFESAMKTNKKLQFCKFLYLFKMDISAQYHMTCNYLFAQFPMYQRIGGLAYKEGLEGITALDALLATPHAHFMSIHVAGTNGKGSVAHMLAVVLQKAGFKTGLYTSPHLLDFRERMRINGEMISQKEVVDFVNKHKAALEELQPSFFEITTAMAFDYFARRKVDIAVVEVGMGGRLDATNVLNPILSVITNIGLDHCEFLGHSLAEVAAEKAGIIKAGVPVIIGEHQAETDAVFMKQAAAVQAPLYFAQDEYVVEEASPLGDKQQFMVKDSGKLWAEPYCVDLQGQYQKHNLVTVLAALRLLRQQGKLFGGKKMEDKLIREALLDAARFTGLRGRWEMISKRPRIIADTGHNAHGLRLSMVQLQEEKYRRLHFVFGLVAEKDLTDILPLLPKEAYYYFTRAQLPRALDARILAEACRNAGLQGQVVDRVSSALAVAKGNAWPDDLIFVGGSTFVVAEAISYCSQEI